MNARKFTERYATLEREATRLALVQAGALAVGIALAIALAQWSPTLAGVAALPLTLWLGFLLIRRGEIYILLQAKLLARVLGNGFGAFFWKTGTPVYTLGGWIAVLSFVLALASLALGGSPGDWVDEQP